jgi:autotransporter-associated beta strand protein
MIDIKSAFSTPIHRTAARVAAAVCVVSLVWCSEATAQIQLTEVTRYNLFEARNPETPTGNLNPLYTGNNTSAVAWNGSRLFVAGINNVSPSDTTGIIEILNTATTGIVPSTAVQYGSRFGAQAGTVESGRGYSGLTLSGNRLYAAWDNDTGNNGAGQFAGYDISTTTASTLWTTNNRGSAGVAIDPGYVVSGSSLGGSGVAWATFGGGTTNPPGSAERRALTDPETGAFIYGFGASGTVPAGFDWRPVGSAGVGRDISFDPDTGNLYGRSDNLVTAAVRTGTNSASPVTFIGGTASGGSASGQNIAFMSNTVAGDLLAFNNRQSGATNQTFTQAVRLMSTSGSVQSVNWNFLGGAGYGNQVVQGPIYDFAFDPVSQTLAVVGAQGTLGLSIFRFGAPTPSTRLEWAASGTTQGGDGTWSTSGTTWSGAYGPEVWNPAAQAVFTGTAFPTSAVTVAAGGASVGRGMSFVTNGYTIGGGAITLTGTTASTNNVYVEPGVTATVNTAISSTAGFTKSGGGTLVVGGTITGGNLSINNGTLAVAPTGAIQSSPGISILASGTLDVTQLAGGYVVPGGRSLAGAGLVSGSVTMSAGATLSPGSNLGTLTIANDLTVNGGANYNWQIVDGSGVAGSAWDLVQVGGALTIASTATSPYRINLWSLSSTGPDVSGSAANFDSTQNYSWTIASAAGGISGFASDKFVINTSGTNGTSGFANAFGNGTFSLAQSGNDLNLVFTAGAAPTVITINVPSGTQTQTQAGYPTLSGSVPVVKTGAGTLVLDQANTLSGSTTVQGGVVQLANGSGLSASRLVVVAGGTGQVAPYLATSVASLDLASGNGLMDLTSGALTISSGMTATELVAEILEGRGDGTWNGASGITSSTAAAEVAGGVPRAVGWIDNGDGSLTAAYAAPGDTNIDWSIDILDASNFLAFGKFDSGSPAVWVEGDFSYDGIVDILDAADFFATGLYDAGNYNTAPGLSGGIAAVPEPTTGLAMVAVGGLAYAIRMRRRR